MLGVAVGGPSSRPLFPPSPLRPHLCAVLILVGVGLEVAPSPGERPPTSAGSARSSPVPSDPGQALSPPVTTLPARKGPGPAEGAPRPDLAPPLLPKVSPAPSSSFRASCCWSQAVRAGGRGGAGRAGGGAWRGGAGEGRGGAGWASSGADWPRPAVYHVIFIYCAVKGQRGFQFFYLPYFEK